VLLWLAFPAARRVADEPPRGRRSVLPWLAAEPSARPISELAFRWDASTLHQKQSRTGPSQHHSHVGSEATQIQEKRCLLIFDRSLLITGLCLLVFYSMALFHSHLASNLALREFDKAGQIVADSPTGAGCGSGWIAGTTRPVEVGTAGIPAHRDGFFRGLKDISEREAIELATVHGATVYVVDQLEIVKPENVEVLRPRGGPSLTFVTCYPFYFVGPAPRRFILHAALQNRFSNSQFGTVPH